MRRRPGRRPRWLPKESWVHESTNQDGAAGAMRRQAARQLVSMASERPTKVKSRDISRSVEAMLWGRAAGHCEFDGCNRELGKSPVTQERVNLAEKAHIYSF